MADHTLAQSIHAGDHVSVFYDEPAQCWQLLADYFQEGFRQQELCVLATPVSPEEAARHFKHAGLDIKPQLESGQMRIFDMQATYLADGKFVSEYMLHNVSSFIEDAETQGYQGLRTAGEMKWVFDHPDMQLEAAQYEHDVNDLSKKHPRFTGLCLYAVQQDSLPVVHDAIRHHPVFVYDGELHQNPYYLAPEHFLSFLATELTDQRRSSWLYDREQLTYPLTPADQAIKKLFTRAAPEPQLAD